LLSLVEDAYENLGAQLVREVAEKTADAVGDGTTTATVLAQSILNEGLQNVTAGANPIILKRGMDKALDSVLKEIDQMSIAIKDNQDTKNIATVSASGSLEVGDKIAECFAKVGKDGVVAIEEGKSTEDVIELVDGMQFDRGYLSAYFATNAEKMGRRLNRRVEMIIKKDEEMN